VEKRARWTLWLFGWIVQGVEANSDLNALFPISGGEMPGSVEAGMGCMYN